MNLLDRPTLIYDAEKYYKLLQDKFLLTKKDRQATSPLERIRYFSLFILLGYGALVISSKSNRLTILENNEFLNGIKIIILDNEKLTFINVFIVYLGVVLLTGFLEYYFKQRKAPKLLNDDLYHFCLIFDSYSKLKSYSINKREDYVDSMLPVINEYLENTSITIDVVESDPGLRFHGNPIHQLNQIEQRYSWFNATDETKMIAKAFGVFPYIIADISSQNSNWESLLPLFENLLIFEYSNILTQSEIPNKDKIKELGFSSLLKFGKLTEEMYQFEESLKTTNSITKFGGKIKIAITKANQLLFSKNIFVLFFSWFVFVLLFTWAILSLSMKLTGVTIDSKILIGGFAAALAGSIAIAGQIQSSHKKDH